MLLQYQDEWKKNQGKNYANRVLVVLKKESQVIEKEKSQIRKTTNTFTTYC